MGDKSSQKIEDEDEDEEDCQFEKRPMKMQKLNQIKPN